MNLPAQAAGNEAVHLRTIRSFEIRGQRGVRVYLFFMEPNVCHRQYEMLRAQKNKPRVTFEILTSFSCERVSVQTIKNTDLGTVAAIATVRGYRTCSEEIPALLRHNRFHVSRQQEFSSIFSTRNKKWLIKKLLHDNESSLSVRRENPAWVSAAEKFYGSWGNTLFAAGHNPNEHLVHLRWSKKKRKTLPLGIRRNPLLLENYKAQQQRAI